MKWNQKFADKIVDDVGKLVHNFFEEFCDALLESYDPYYFPTMWIESKISKGRNFGTDERARLLRVMSRFMKSKAEEELRGYVKQELDSWNEYIRSEEFIDAIVTRINCKQLNT
jgi:hypothetical protein